MIIYLTAQLSKSLKSLDSLLKVMVLAFLSSACRQNPVPTLNFYHWKAKFQLDPQEKQYLQHLGTQKLYVRLFDVDFRPDKGAVPVGNTVIVDSTASVSIVGVVFITNRTMLQIAPSALEELAEKITRKIFQKTAKMPLVGIQLDCDWTDGSRKNFFRLCELIRKICQKRKLELSATIRLHQFKYTQQTGVPPIDKGVLMLYNVGDIDGKNTENSILEQKKVDEYLKNAKPYPLPLAVALPLFRWAVVQRLGKTVHLLSQITKEDLENNVHLEKTQKNLYVVKENHYFGGAYLYEGDALRWEAITWESLETLSRAIAKQMTTHEIIFYHLDTKIIKNYRYEKLKSLAYHWN